MKRGFRSKRGQAPSYPTLSDGRKLLVAGLLGLSTTACGVTSPYDDNQTVVKAAKDGGHKHVLAPDAGELMMGVAPGPGLDAETPVPDAGELMMGEAPEPGLDAAVPVPGPDASDLIMGDIAAPEADAATPPPPGPDAGDMMMGGMGFPEDAGD